ncbi:MAG: excinuclease ABC subunit UvrC [Eubacterium sp.]|nr:excinuclease ABC subunit UvrC [Eubacterium sp.]
MKEFDIEEELKKLPHHPGVYLMRSNSEELLYVGKAVDLHNRVRQYFRSGHGHNNSPKILRMVEQIAYFEYILTGSEMEALVLECNLIKEHRPKYNTLMTDDKGYPYIRVTLEEPYPRVLYSHQMRRDHSKYFGPYTDARAVQEMIAMTNQFFQLRTCNRSLPRDIGKERPCLYYQIGKCCGPCTGDMTQSDYLDRVSDAMNFLRGNTGELLRDLKEEMKQYAAQLEFEKAASVRDRIERIHHIMDKQLMQDTNSDNRDIVAMARGEEDSVVTVFFVRDGQLLGRENHHMTAENDDTDSAILGEFIKQYYGNCPYIPKEILTRDPIPEAEMVMNYLSEKKGSKVLLFQPKRGDKAGLLRLAEENAVLVLSQDLERIKKKEMRTTGAVKEIAEKLGIPAATRMEAFDISHISGYHSVASMVVFENGEPRRNAYRKFRLRTIEGPDDYASMKEVLSRRYTNDSLGPLPDVLMMDGGKGQVHVAEMVLDSLGFNIPVCGMVKDDRHRTRGLYYKDREVEFPPGSEAMHMITALQDETHRFAITFHRSLRSKEQTHSILDDIAGVGPKRRQALMLRYRSIDELKAADVEELSNLPGMNRKAAEAVYTFFHPDDETKN